MDSIVHGQTDGDTGNQPGNHGKFDIKPSHDPENDNDGKQIGRRRNKTDFAWQEKDKHNAENENNGDGQALYLSTGKQMTAGGYDHPEPGYIPAKGPWKWFLDMIHDFFTGF